MVNFISARLVKSCPRKLSFMYRADVIKSFCQNSRVTCLSRMTVQGVSGIKQTGFWELGITRKCFLLQEDERNTTTIDVNKNNNNMDQWALYGISNE